MRRLTLREMSYVSRHMDLNRAPRSEVQVDESIFPNELLEENILKQSLTCSIFKKNGMLWGREWKTASHLKGIKCGELVLSERKIMSIIIDREKELRGII